MAVAQLMRLCSEWKNGPVIWTYKQEMKHGWWKWGRENHLVISSYGRLTGLNEPKQTRDLTRVLYRTLTPDTETIHNILLSARAPSTTTTSSLTVDAFASRITDDGIHQQPVLYNQPPPTHFHFSFSPLTENKVSKLSMPAVVCPFPSHLLKEISTTLLPALTHLISTSFTTGSFPTAFKQNRSTIIRIYFSLHHVVKTELFENKWINLTMQLSHCSVDYEKRGIWKF